MNRDTEIIKLRPAIPIAGTDGKTSKEEQFQNKIVRPILKFQHDIIVAIIMEEVIGFHKHYDDFSDIKKDATIEAMIDKNQRLKNKLFGSVISLFTLEEFELYKTIKGDTNRRILQMVKQRVISTLN